MKALSDRTYYQRYCTQAKRFEVAGCVLVAISILMDLLEGKKILPVTMLVLFFGALALIVGGSSLRPHNVVKSFALHCAETPSREFASGLLEALEAQSRLKLVKSSIATVENAIEVYARQENTNPELVEKLRAALEQRISKKIF